MFDLSFADNGSRKFEIRCKRLKHCAEKLVNKGKNQRFGNLSVNYLKIPSGPKLSDLAVLSELSRDQHG